MEQAKEVIKIEGISPDMLWTFLVVLVGLATLFLLGYKVIEVFRKEKKHKQEQQQLAGQDITDRIASKVEEKLEPKFTEINSKFAEIDEKLSTDKANIDSHARQLNAYEDRVDKLERGNNALIHGVFALLGHQIDGNGIDKLRKSYSGMKNYLMDGEYKEDIS